MFEAMKFLTVAMGGVSCFCSLCLAVYFFRSEQWLPRAVAYMYFAESIALACTVAFSIGEGVMVDAISPVGEMTLRWVMFGAATASSIHMAVAIDRVLRGQDG